jgi:alanine racemase
MLYGISPFLDEHGAQQGLSPVMSLYAPLIAIHQCPAGAAVGYSGSYICPESMPVGVIGIGYGDGYPRHAPTGTPVLLAGHRVPIIGRVSMDMISVDLRGLPELPLGTEALLWGRGLPVEEIATCANTIAYQLVTGLTRRVLPVHLL